MPERYLQKNIQKDLREKMVMVGGARQVGKTTMALHILGAQNEEHPAYCNWDDIPTRRLLLQGTLPPAPLVVFDEIHKYKGWRNLLKGFYDRHKSNQRFLVTGSARLDYYRRGGDSLQGRYHYYRLHPFTLFEAHSSPADSDTNHLLTYGGFPEPFFKGDQKHWKRWQKEHHTRVLQEDLLGLEQVKEISQLDLLASILPERVGSPLSINNLKQDLSVAFETVDRWIGILENIYFCFRISPFGLPKLRAAKKEKKLYLWDWSLCMNPAARFENMVASHLLKYCHYLEDTEGDDMGLSFIRDANKREIDFVVTRNKKPIFAVECKSGEQNLSERIVYFAPRTSIPIFYQVHLGKKHVESPRNRCLIIPFRKFCEEKRI